MKIKPTLILLISFVIFTSFTNQQKINSYSKNGISFLYPSSWYEFDSNDNSFTIKASPLKVKLEKAVAFTFSVEIDSINTNLDNYLSTYKNEWSANEYIKNWRIISQSEITNNGYNGYQLITESTTNAYSTEIECKTRVYLIQQKNRIVNISATASKVDFDNHLKTIDDLFLSLKLD